MLKERYKLKSKKSFLVHIDSLDILDDLTDEQCGQLFKAIKAFQNNDKLELSSLVKIAFSPFKNQFIRDDEKYQITCDRRAKAGSLGGKQKVANASKSKQKVANLADKKNKSKNKTNNDSDNKKERSSRFTPPSLSEVISYCNERANFVSPQAFIDHYEANGWMRGKNKIKDWKACIRTWEKSSGKGHRNEPMQFSETTRQNIINAEAFING